MSIFIPGQVHITDLISRSSSLFQAQWQPPNGGLKRLWYASNGIGNPKTGDTWQQALLRAHGLELVDMAADGSLRRAPIPSAYCERPKTQELNSDLF